jgi:hypothetical protein
MANNTANASGGQPDPIVTALKEAIAELKKSHRDSPLRQYADEVDDILRRYVAQNVSTE